jgi:hypothetical protein
MTLLNKFKKMMKEAHEIINSKEVSKEALKINTFRVGSSGAVVDGEIYSTQCGRLAQARYLGAQSPPTQEMRVMFNGGLTLEDYLAKSFESLGLSYVAEKEYNREILPGITVSGRPDFEVVVYGIPVGIEAKSLASPFSVIKQRKNKFPYMKHMIQAAAYMTLLERDHWLIAIGHSFHVNERGLRIPPEVKWFELTYLNDMFIVTNELNESRALPFNKAHIRQYYVELKKGLDEQKLVGRPKEEELNIDTYSRCKYCPMQSACNEYDNGLIGFSDWIKRILVNKEPKQGE